MPCSSAASSCPVRRTSLPASAALAEARAAARDNDHARVREVDLRYQGGRKRGGPQVWTTLAGNPVCGRGRRGAPALTPVDNRDCPAGGRDGQGS
ncbi:hypothetical protein AB5J56_39005 [Streptomyces sp. R21]|uniref:Uncharacterized protein n=1 Tax=Streptomyces sp. R21 TaxID=3238627 RepID=A0AB39PKJ0_9ACTN